MFFISDAQPHGGSITQSIRLFTTLQDVLKGFYNSWNRKHPEYKASQPFENFLFRAGGTRVYFGSSTEEPRKISKEEIRAVAEELGLIAPKNSK
jgi:hypothetical protein